MDECHGNAPYREDDLRNLVGQKATATIQKIKLVSLYATLGTEESPRATVKILIDGKVIEGSAMGNGAVNACFKAIDICVNKQYILKEFMIQAASTGSDAQACVNIALEYNGKQYWGRGLHTDTILAAGYAYVDAINKFI